VARLKKEAFHAAVLDMELGWKRTARFLLRDVQMHPFKQLILHIDFQRVDANDQTAHESATALQR
jgi:large subunit ribosomal protein L25